MKATNVSALDLGALNLSPRTLAALQDPKTWQRNLPQQMPQKRNFSEVQSSMQQPSKPDFSTNSSAGDALMHANSHLHPVNIHVQSAVKIFDFRPSAHSFYSSKPNSQIRAAMQFPSLPNPIIPPGSVSPVAIENIQAFAKQMPDLQNTVAKRSRKALTDRKSVV